MNTDDYRFLHFSVLDYTNSHITSGYTLPITPFTFIPKFDSGDNKPVSNTRIIWDFGDGTISREITATHFYKIPGTYSVKCYFYGAGGIGYESSFCQNILVRDFITDTIVVSADTDAVIRASHYESPFLLSRFNSWQTFNTLSSEGCDIILNVRENAAPLLNAETYFYDKYGHLKPSSRFALLEYNNTLSTYDAIPVNRIKTKNNKNIFVKLDKNKNIVFCNPNDSGSVLAGTSGQALVYFTDDHVKQPIKGVIEPTIITASLDFSNFLDNDNVNINEKINYPILNNQSVVTYAPRIFYQERINSVSFSTNGIDSEGPFVNNTFDIGKNKFIGQKIPFVAKFKDEENFSSKTWKKLILKKENEELVENSIKFYLTDGTTDTVIPSAFDIYEDYGEFENYEKLGFFKGYIIPKISRNNVKICCDFNVAGEEFAAVNTKYIFFTNPISPKAFKFDINRSYDDTINVEKTKQNVLDTQTLTGLYAGIVIPNYKSGKITTDFWAIDSDQDLIAKIDYKTNSVSKFNLVENSSPSFLAADKKGNIWVTLYDSVSVCKLSSNGNILFYTKPSYENQDYTSNTNYIPQSGAAGSNSILPALVDTDINSNAWVAYNYTLSSFLCVYTENGTLTSTIDIDRSYIAIDILCSDDSITWVLLKNNVSGKDALLKINQISKEQTIYYTDHKLWAMSNDMNRSLWFIGNKNDIIQFSIEIEEFLLFATLESESINNSVDCNFNGIATTTQGDLLIFDNLDKNIKIIRIDDNDPYENLRILKINNLDTSRKYQNILNARGDCTGFKFIKKYLHDMPVFMNTGHCSNVFDINPLSGNYNISKINENFDMHAQIKNLSFQESLKNSNVLFDDFFKAIMGDTTSNQNSLGKKMYERIANFVDNNSCIDTCNVEKLNSLHKMLNEDMYIFNTYNFPSNITRLLDLFSIKLTKLKGERNKFDQNFDTKGYNSSSNVIFGKNLGSELNFYNAVFTSGIDKYIVAYERFSGYYTICNTNVISAAYIDSDQRSYALSSYDISWGWNLVLPPVYEPTDIPKYYTFYNFVSGYSNEQTDGVINWSDKLTTITEQITSYSDWWNIAENILTRELMVGLELLSSNS